MLSISIYLYSHIITMIHRILISRLNRSSNSQINRKINDVIVVLFTDFFCMIR